MRYRIVAFLTAAAITALGAVMLNFGVRDTGPIADAKLGAFLLLAGRLFLALGLTLAIGLERETHDKPAGMRTIAMVGVGACLFGLIALELAGGGDAQSRVIQGVITGIGFLGAGTIIKEQFHVGGLTTAATLWTAAGIGLAVGLGLYPLAVLATLAVFVVLIALRLLERLLHRRDAPPEG